MQPAARREKRRPNTAGQVITTPGAATRLGELAAGLASTWTVRTNV
jgi:hypothetical protein